MDDEIPRFTTLAGDGTVEIRHSLSLRPVRGSDEALLLQIFAESHCAGFELMGLEPAALQGLIRMQFQARQAQYRRHPGAVEQLIYRGAGDAGLPVGSCWLADTAERLRVLDIAVLAEHRRRGIARSVLSELCAPAAAAAKPVELSVWHANAPAIALYRALGFEPAGDGRTGGSGTAGVPGDPGGPSDPADPGSGYLELRFSAASRTRHRAGAR